ncbi:MAG: response regulator [Desulfuromonadia bacterium]
MAEFQLLHSVLIRSVTQACDESSMLLGQTFGATEEDCLNTNRITYFSDTDDPMMVATVESREEYPGFLYMVFTLRDAILLSGLMLGIPPARIAEKRRLAILESDDIDAFGEIMNQIIGSFNSVFQPGFPKKSHLKLISHRKFVPGIDEMGDNEPFPEGEYHLCRFRLSIPGQEMDRLDVFVSQELAFQFDPPSPPGDGETAAGGEPEGGESTGAAAPQMETDGAKEPAILILDDDEGDRKLLSDSLTGLRFPVITAPTAADIRSFFSRSDIVLVIVGVPHPDDHHFSLCIKISSLQREGKPVPLIMAAREWTRSAVLKAIKYGARDIIMTPATPDEILSKARRVMGGS